MWHMLAQQMGSRWMRGGMSRNDMAASATMLLMRRLRTRPVGCNISASKLRWY